MSTKPSDVGRFAVDGSDVDATNIVAPSAGLRNTGWPTNAVPTSGNLNYLENLGYRWRKYLSDGALTGDHSFSGNVTFNGALITTAASSLTGTVVAHASPTESVLTPIAQFEDWSTRSRATVDHLGYRQGQLTEWEETWRTTSTTMPTGWTATLATGGTATITEPSSTFPQRSVGLAVIASAGSSAILTPEFVGFLDDNRTLTFEQTVFVPSIAGAGTRLNTIETGLQFSHAGANDFFAVFRINTTSANWRAVVIGSGTTDDDTSYAVNINGITRLKLEISGSGQSGASAGTFTARFFIDGVLRTTRTFTSPVADKFRPYYKHSTSGVAIGTGAFLAGRPRICFNHVNAGDNW